MFRQTLIALILLGTACYGTLPRHPTVKATALNKEVAAVVEAYARAMESLDADALVALADDSYAEDQGTADPSDDYAGRDELLSRAKDRFSKIQKLHINVNLKEVLKENGKVRARYQVMMRFRYKMPSGESWERHDDIEEMVLVRRDGKLLIQSGL